MIDTFEFPLDRFDLDGFIEGYRQMYRSWSGEDADADASVPVMDGFEGIPMPKLVNRDLKRELVDDHKLLFFQMHEPVATDEVLCIDGSRQDGDAFDIGVSDGYGFLVEVDGDRISLHPALYDGSSDMSPRLTPRIHLQAHCAALDEIMAKYAKQWACE